MKMLFIGATGMLGRPVLQEMRSAGFEVTALVRNSAKAKLSPEVRVIEGDLRDDESLKRAITGQDAIYLNLSVAQNERPGDFHPELDGLRKIIPLAIESKVKQIGMISSLVQNYQGMNGFKWWVFDAKRQSAQLLRESGLNYFIFSPSSFMENFTNGSYVSGRMVRLAGKSKHKMYFVAGRDYGRMVVRAYQTLIGQSHEFSIQGPEAFTADEAARVFVENSAVKYLVMKAPLWPLKVIGLVSQKMNYGARILEALNNYPEQFNSSEVWARLGKPETTLARFAKEARQ
jgi:uncharacterized protein YbjT (DUF2867 family)